MRQTNRERQRETESKRIIKKIARSNKTNMFQIGFLKPIRAFIGFHFLIFSLSDTKD